VPALYPKFLLLFLSLLVIMLGTQTIFMVCVTSTSQAPYKNIYKYTHTRLLFVRCVMCWICLLRNIRIILVLDIYQDSISNDFFGHIFISAECLLMLLGSAICPFSCMCERMGRSIYWFWLVWHYRILQNIVEAVSFCIRSDSFDDHFAAFVSASWAYLTKCLLK